MTTIPELAGLMQALFGETANRLGRETGFIQRARVLSGSSYAQTLVYGWLSKAQSTLSDLSQTAAVVGTPISKQGLDPRFGEKSAQFMQALLETALKKLVEAEPCGMGLVQRFEYVHIIDSTTVALPEGLAALWAGCGGDGHKAALKINVDWEMRRGAIRGELSAGRQHDQRAQLAQPATSAGSLRLTDVGYFNLRHLEQLAEQNSYWLIRLKSRTTLYTLDGLHLDWVKLLQQTNRDHLTCEVEVGARRLPARLCATRLSPQAAERRQNLLRKTAHKKQQPISDQAWFLTEWAICITNVPPTLLSFAEVMVLLRLRWQIELLFKLWKSHGLLDESRSVQPYHILTELYAKLLALLLQHWLILLALWDLPNRSLSLAVQLIHKFAYTLAIALPHVALLSFVLTVLQHTLPTCTMSSLRTTPHTYQRLADPPLFP
jgi:hypothetical protein